MQKCNLFLVKYEISTCEVASGSGRPLLSYRWFKPWSGSLHSMGMLGLYRVSSAEKCLDELNWMTFDIFWPIDLWAFLRARSNGERTRPKKDALTETVYQHSDGSPGGPPEKKIHHKTPIPLAFSWKQPQTTSWNAESSCWKLCFASVIPPPSFTIQRSNTCGEPPITSRANHQKEIETKRIQVA